MAKINKPNGSNISMSNIVSKFGKLDSYTKSTTEAQQKGPNFSSYQKSIPINYKILGSILFLVICIGMYIFYMNPLNVLYYAQVPFIIFYILVMFCVLIFIERYVNNTTPADANLIEDLKLKFVLYFKSYVNYVLLFLLFTVVSYFIYKYIKQIFVFILNISLPVTLGLVILILSLFSNYSKTNTFDNATLDLIKDIVMYIPCLLTDTIDFLKKDYQNTPSSVFIVFIILVVYCLIFYLVPMVKKEMYKNDGVVILEKPVYLNKIQVNMTTSELRQKVLDAMPFYDRWIQNLLQDFYSIDYNMVNTDISNVDLSANDISYNIHPVKRKTFDLLVPPDKVTMPYYENFTTLMNEDTMFLNETNNSLYQIQDKIIGIITSKDAYVADQISKLRDRPQELRDYIKQVIQNEPYLLSLVEKASIVYAAFLATRDSTVLTIADVFRPLKTEPRVYRYSLSLWIYLHHIEPTKNKQVLLEYGTLPSLYYDSNTSLLTLEYQEYQNSGSKKVLYSTDNILFQRWNHFVITYSYGTVDLFINNNLVGNYRNISPYLYDDALLTIGSKDNSNIGGVCNVKYYVTPLSASKIKSIYTQFNNKDPPI